MQPSAFLIEWILVETVGSDNSNVIVQSMTKYRSGKDNVVVSIVKSGGAVDTH